ncbi:MAG: AsmA-like C-terminal domain-containing protein, partial [Phycisphaeraceae bacterium]|nr:AsmA-like C-terminal domain-containing protein [Phycisphaeraceae bacterium]
QPVLTVIRSLELDGRYRFRDARLRYAPPTDQRPALQLTGKLELHDAHAQLGVPITELDGIMAVDVAQTTDSTWPRINLQLTANRLRANDRQLTELQVDLFNAVEEPQTLAIRNLNSLCYEGKVHGYGQVGMESGAWQFRLTLEDVLLQGMLHPKDPLDREAATTTSPPATVAADLEVAGVGADEAQRRGRGAISVRNTSMYDVPVAMALLQLLNAAPPTARSFNRMDAQYLVEGRNVHFDTLRLQSDTIDIEGSGDMKLDTLAIQLDLHTRNRAGKSFAPVSDLFRVFKDELVTITVGGTLDQPQASITSLTGIRDSIRRIFRPQYPAGSEPQSSPASPSTSGQ